MVPASFEESNAILDKPDGWTYEQCDPLSILRTSTTDGAPVVVSCWKCSQEELEDRPRVAGGLWPHDVPSIPFRREAVRSMTMGRTLGLLWSQAANENMRVITKQEFHRIAKQATRIIVDRKPTNEALALHLKSFQLMVGPSATDKMEYATNVTPEACIWFRLNVNTGDFECYANPSALEWL